MRAPGLVISLGALLLIAAPGAASAEEGRPILVIRFANVVTPGPPERTAVVIDIERPDGTHTNHSVETIEGSCREDVGGLDSLMVLSCQTTSGRREYQVFQVGLRIVVDVSTVDSGGRWRRIRRQPIVTGRPGWFMVPRCREQADDAHACPPERQR